jgi:hypothetical protein
MPINRILSLPSHTDTTQHTVLTQTEMLALIVHQDNSRGPTGLLEWKISCAGARTADPWNTRPASSPFLHGTPFWPLELLIHIICAGGDLYNRYDSSLTPMVTLQKSDLGSCPPVFGSGPRSPLPGSATFSNFDGPGVTFPRAILPHSYCMSTQTLTGAPVAFKTWHQYRMGIICPLWLI